MSKKAYVIQTGEYEDVQIIGVVTDKKLANKIVYDRLLHLYELYKNTLKTIKTFKEALEKSAYEREEVLYIENIYTEKSQGKKLRELPLKFTEWKETSRHDSYKEYFWEEAELMDDYGSS